MSRSIAWSNHNKEVSIVSAVLVFTIKLLSTSWSSWPSNRQEEGALFESVYVVRDAMVERKQAARAKVEGPPRGSQLNVA